MVELLRVCDGACRVGTGTCLGPAFVFPREVCGGRVRKKRLRLWEGAGGGRECGCEDSCRWSAFVCVCVCVCVALSGVAAWFELVAVRRQRLCGCAWVALSRRRRAVSLPAAAGGGSPWGGRCAASQECGLLGEIG